MISYLGHYDAIYFSISDFYVKGANPAPWSWLGSPVTMCNGQAGWLFKLWPFYKIFCRLTFPPSVPTILRVLVARSPLAPTDVTIKKTPSLLQFNTAGP